MILAALSFLTLCSVQEPVAAATTGYILEVAPRITAAAPVAAPADPQSSLRFDVIVLANAVAAEVSPVVGSFLGEGETVVADPRTNSLLVSADEARLKQLRRVIAEIDMPHAKGVAQADLFPAPSGDLVIAAESAGSMTMMSLAQEYARLTDQHFVIRPDTTTYLEQARTGLSRSVVVPKAEVQSFFEQILIQNDFVLQILRKDAPRLLSIESLQTGSRTTLRTDAIIVSEAELGRYTAHPSLLITTVIHLPNTDVRQLSNSMRTMITDANTQQMLPAGNTDSMVLTGFASNVAALARMLRIVDDASAVETVGPVYRRFALEFAKAEEISAAIVELVNAGARRGPGPGPEVQGASVARRGRTDARVMPDARTNALVVMAMPADMKSIEELVKLFDVKQ